MLSTRLPYCTSKKVSIREFDDYKIYYVDREKYNRLKGQAAARERAPRDYGACADREMRPEIVLGDETALS